MKHAELTSVLAAVGKPTHSVDVGAGARVLLLPHGGRVLGLFSAKDGENFYWTHPALQTPETASAFYASGAWENSGGDRTWLAPEVDIFFPEYPDLDMSKYFQPRQLDPGRYQVDESGGVVTLRNRLSLRFSRSQKIVELEMAKWVKPAPNPFRYEREFSIEDDLEFCGYEQHTTLELLGHTRAPVGLWNLIQMPHKGEMIVPVYFRALPKIYFGLVDSQVLNATEDAIRWHMRANGEQKIGIRAAATKGRAGYLYNSSESTTLIVRNFVVNPSGEYVDTPWADSDDLGYAVQACNVDSFLGSFSELEYHVPAIGQTGGPTRCEDVSQVWAFRGRKQTVHRVAALLLGVNDFAN